MNNKDFTTSFSVAASSIDVYNAINNVKGWWSENIDGKTDTVNEAFAYHYKDVHQAKFQVTELVPGKKIKWHVTDNYFSFTQDQHEWKDTDIVFEISEKDGLSQLTFTHLGLVPEYECFQVCHDAWTHYIHNSLKDLILSGKGSPTPKEMEEESITDGTNDAKENLENRITHRLLIESPAETVYMALTKQQGLAGWWTPETIAEPKEGSVSRFTFGPDYTKEIRVEKLRPYSRVEWKVLSAFEDWIDTIIRFELEPHKKGTMLSFFHSGWKKYSPEIASCSYDWALFLRSLKLYCETGKGLPYPEFNK